MIPPDAPDAQELRCLLALLRTPTIGPVRFQRLLDHYTTATALYHLPADRGTLKHLGIPEAGIDALQKPDWAGVDQDIAWQTQPQRHILTKNDPAYPYLLQQIPAAPPILFVHGTIDALQAPQLGIVGTRNPSHSGLNIAHEFANLLAQAGIVITSGLALGIDAAAHEGALSAPGRTIAVVGTGLDRVYPARHHQLAHRIVENGALLSELPIGTPVAAENFPRRNRLISGLSLGVLVVEAAAHSGALITARQALEQGREVFAIPGSIHNPLSKGCHHLIRDGAAKLVEQVADILNELGPLAATGPTSMFVTGQKPTTTATRITPAPTATAAAPEVGTTDEYQQLLVTMGAAPVGIDLLVEQTGLTVEAVSSMLLILELQGRVEATRGGGQYRRL